MRAIELNYIQVESPIYNSLKINNLNFDKYSIYVVTQIITFSEFNNKVSTNQ